MNNLLEYKMDLIAAALGVYKIDEISSVILRRYIRTDGEEAMLVDFYPEWNAMGTYGKMKIASEYLDHPWQIERFEKYSGLSVSSMPLLEADQAIRRRFGQTHRNEVKPIRPFRLMIQPRKDDDGNNEKTLILRYLPSPQARRQPSTPTREPAPQVDRGPVMDVREEGAAVKRQPQTGVVIPEKDWLQETITAANQDDFAISISRLHPELFDDANRAAKLWESMFRGLPYRQDHAVAYLNGMKTCASKFSAEQAAGKEKAVAYAEAKTAGMDHYETTLDLISRSPVQAEMPLPGGGNNYARS